MLNLLLYSVLLLSEKLSNIITGRLTRHFYLIKLVCSDERRFTGINIPSSFVFTLILPSCTEIYSPIWLSARNPKSQTLIEFSRRLAPLHIFVRPPQHLCPSVLSAVYLVFFYHSVTIKLSI